MRFIGIVQSMVGQGFWRFDLVRDCEIERRRGEGDRERDKQGKEGGERERKRRGRQRGERERDGDWKEGGVIEKEGEREREREGKREEGERERERERDRDQFVVCFLGFFSNFVYYVQLNYKSIIVIQGLKSF